MAWMRPTNSFVLKTPYKEYQKRHHSTTSKSFDQCCFPAAFQDMRTMENGLPFATPVLKLFQRLPVEEKAGAITYVAVTSVAWRRKQWSSGQCRRIGSFNGTSFWRMVSSQMTAWTYSGWIACHEFRKHWWICTCICMQVAHMTCNLWKSMRQFHCLLQSHFFCNHMMGW